MAIHVGDTVRFPFLAKKNGVVWPVDGATTKILYLQKPDGTILTKTLTYTTDGSDGYLEYTTIATTDLAKAQGWQAQLYIVKGATVLHSDWFAFSVEGNIA